MHKAQGRLAQLDGRGECNGDANDPNSNLPKSKSQHRKHEQKKIVGTEVDGAEFLASQLSRPMSIGSVGDDDCPVEEEAELTSQGRSLAAIGSRST